MRLRHCEYRPGGILWQLREIFERLTRSDSARNAQAWFPGIAAGMAIAILPIKQQEAESEEGPWQPNYGRSDGTDQS